VALLHLRSLQVAASPVGHPVGGGAMPEPGTKYQGKYQRERPTGTETHGQVATAFRADRGKAPTRRRPPRLPPPSLDAGMVVGPTADNLFRWALLPSRIPRTRHCGGAGTLPSVLRLPRQATSLGHLCTHAAMHGRMMITAAQFTNECGMRKSEHFEMK